MANNYKIKMKDIQNKYKFKIFCAGYEYDDTELRNEISQRALISEAGRYVELELNPNTYVLTAKLKDKNNNVISTSTPIDLPLESMIVDCDYDATTKSLIITLQNGNTTSIPLGDLISGLATEEDLEEVDAKVDANIEKISDLENELNQYKTIYNVLPKVEDEGEELTLDDTGNATMSIDLKGNTSQVTTTGKNLYNINILQSGTKSGITLTKNSDGSVTINGTSTSSVAFESDNFNIGENYILNGCYGGSPSTYKMDFFTNNTIYACYNGEEVSLPNNAYGRVRIVIYEGVNVNNVTIYPMLSLTGGTFEPYTNGASPNPDYPQDVHVVSGDNEINVVGKNLLNLPDSIRTFSGNVNLETSNNTKFTFTGKASAAYYNSFALNYHLPKGTYTMSSTNNSFKYYFWFRDKNNATTYANVHLNNSSKTFTLEEDAETIIVGVEGLTTGNTYNIETYFQLDKGESATSYEVFDVNTYNINLPVENLFNSSLFTNGTIQGITLTKNNDGTITLNGTSTARADFTIIDLFSLKGDNKIASIFKKGGTTTGNVTFGIYDSNWTNGKQCNITSSSDIGNVSLPSEVTLTKCFIRIESGITLSNLTIALQIEQGAKVNQFTPYGTTPIELCKIGDYQDSIKKSTGKNLCNTTFELGGIDTTTGQNGSGTDRVRTKDYVEIKANTTYTLSGVQGSRVVCFYNSSKAYLSYAVVGSQSTSGTFTTPSNTSYIRWYIIQTNTNIYEMLNEGSSALPYQPYGVGKWYLHKEIGKVVLNGSENWIRSGNTSESFFCGALAGVSIPFEAKMGTASDSKTNYFVKGNKGSNAEVFDMYNGTDYYTTFALYLSTSRATDVTTFKNWLGTHNVILYYVLTTPTTTEITYQPLIDQLNILEQAQSKENQTNISQINNDAPFIIDATALKDLSNL